MVDWAAGTTHRIGRNIAAVRKRKKMSAQAVADICTEQNVPMKRTSIANLENGRRDSVTVTDLMAIAAALEVPPVALMYPTDQAGTEIEMVPGTHAVTFDALSWFTGEAVPGTPHADEEVGLLTNLRNIRSAEAQARRFIGQLQNDPSNEDLRKTLEGHAVMALRNVLPYREVCAQVLSVPLPIPDDLADLYARAELEQSQSSGTL